MTPKADVFAFHEEDMETPVPIELANASALVFSRCHPEAARANQDGALVVAMPSGRGLLAVADGMGGMPGGGQASRIALEALAKSVLLVDDASDASNALRSAILDGIELANLEVIGMGIGAGTTLAVVETDGTSIRPYHVGDSSILVVGQRGKIKFQNVAHSPTGYALEAGFMEETEALLHQDRHVVSNIVGEDSMHIEVGMRIDLDTRDTVLVASDGLTDNLTVAEIVEIIRAGSLDEAALALAEVCRQRMSTDEFGVPGKADDLTLVLYRA